MEVRSLAVTALQGLWRCFYAQMSRGGCGVNVGGGSEPARLNATGLFFGHYMWCFLEMVVPAGR